jgi:ABC-type phosphate transport system substrate-binding protein
MSKTLAALALAASTAALALTACGGNSGTGPGASTFPNATVASHGSRISPDDDGASSIHAGGATFPAYAYNLGVQPVGLYSSKTQPGPGAGSILASAGTKGTVYYCLTGSGAGRKQFDGADVTATEECAALGDTPVGFGGRKDPLDFNGSDVALASTECCSSTTPYAEDRASTWGQPFEFPTIGGPIVIPYNQDGFTGIGSGKFMQLSTWTYCAIANGTIDDWNDPAITADNGGTSVTGGTSETLDFYFRSDGSGTSYLFTNKLNTACNGSWPAPYNKAPYQQAGKGRTAAWTFGVNQNWPGPGSSGDPNARFIGESGNPGVVAAIQTNEWGTGYAEGAWVASTGPGTYGTLEQSSLLDTSNSTFVNPTIKSSYATALKNLTAGDITPGEGSDGITLGSSTPWCQLYINPSHFVKPPKGAYPILGLSYWLFYGNNNGVHVPDKKTLIKYIASTGPNSILANLEYTPLNTAIHSAILKAFRGTSSQAACLK